MLNFDCIGVLAYNADGTFDQQKAKSLVNLFRPGKYDEVSMLHFVQSCDGVYKKVRYLRASVGNSTMIDNVLENIFNCTFYFFLALTIMSVMRYVHTGRFAEQAIAFVFQVLGKSFCHLHLLSLPVLSFKD